MKRLLEKDPKKRISATEALNHEVFVKDSKLYESIKNRDSLRIETGLGIRNRLVSSSKEKTGECQSPLLTTKNKERKDPKELRDDSCLKFKMKENLPVGGCQEEG
jgi:serine/threonine protein kinase